MVKDDAMRALLRRIIPLLVISVPLLLSGCKQDSDHEPADDHDAEHEHEHEHEHDHAEGPHGGHLLAINGSSENYQAEWVHDDEAGEVAVFLLDADGKTPISDPPAEVTIEATVGNSPQTFTLPATDVVNGVPSQAAYALTDPTLLTALELIVEGQEPVLRATIRETPVSAKFEPHDHEHDHGHDH